MTHEETTAGTEGRQTHDYRDGTRGWGHDITYKPLPGDRLDACGWGGGIKPGDFVLLSNGVNDTRYCVTKIRYAADPGDMWFATLAFAPRSLDAHSPPEASS
jgi:hypothetical protein